jgi:SH3-like domain-containing protein
MIALTGKRHGAMRAIAVSIMMAMTGFAGAVMAQNSGTPAVQAQDSDAQIQRGAVTNLPLPRYVSLKGSEGNARRGPSLSHRIDWVFRHAGMPLRVVAEFGHWRRVEDKDGAGGWVHYALLSGVRTALVTEDMLPLRTRPHIDADIVARAELGAILRLNECEPEWCRVSGGGQRGWVPKTTIWGVDANELRD